MNDPLRTTLADVVEFLQLHGVKYALVGGLAASFRGQARVTADVDMVMATDIDGALRLLATLDASKFRSLFPDAASVVEKSFILPLRHRTTGVKLDLAVGLSGFERQLVERATDSDIGGCHVAVATTEDLLLMKILAGRPQDDQDLQGMVEVQGDDMDWDYCTTLARELGDALSIDLLGRVITLKQRSSNS